MALGFEKLMEGSAIGIPHQLTDFRNGLIRITKEKFGIIHACQETFLLEGNTVHLVDETIQLSLGTVQDLCEGLTGIIFFNGLQRN